MASSSYWKSFSVCFSVFKFECCVFSSPFGVIRDGQIFHISGLLAHFHGKIPQVGIPCILRFWVSKATSPLRLCSVLILQYLKSLCCHKIPLARCLLIYTKKPFGFGSHLSSTVLAGWPTTNPVWVTLVCLGNCFEQNHCLSGSTSTLSRWVHNLAVLFRCGDYSINKRSCSELIQSENLCTINDNSPFWTSMSSLLQFPHKDFSKFLSWI